MKVFIDCGAYHGSAMSHFMHSEEYSDEWVIHAFEPNPQLKRKYPGAIVHKRAVWTSDKRRDFYLPTGKHRPCSASLMKKKLSGDLDKKHPIKVKCTNIDGWIKRNFKKEDYIILKMDIEGAEYPVLKHMIDCGSIEYINRLHVEFHRKKTKVSEEEHGKLIERLSAVQGLDLRGDYIESSKVKSGKKRWDDMNREGK